MTTLQKLKQELRYANEGLEQVQKAWEVGDYDHQYFNYERDRQELEQQVAKLEKQITNLE